MRDSQFRTLILIQLLVLLLLFPFSPKGKQMVSGLFPSVNYREEALIPELTPAPVSAEISPSEPISPINLSNYYTSLKAELPANYTLVYIRTVPCDFSDELLLHLRQWGFPMMLDLCADNSGELRIFDRAEQLHYDPDSMLMRFREKTLSFFYLDGRLHVWDGDSCMIFERQA